MIAPAHSASPLAPILVLDSGLGGLTVARALRKRLPHEKLLYFGDTARLPYGAKSPGTITTYVGQIIRHFERHAPKHVVIACNTASAVALPELRRRFPGMNISGVIEPGARAAARAAGERMQCVIAIIATEATVRSGAYEVAVAKRRSKACVIQRPTPLLVPIIEEGRRPDDPVVRYCLEQYLQPLKRRKPDVLLLGCTHYPQLRAPIEKIMGPECRVVDSAAACAEDVAARLANAGLLRPPSGQVMADALDPQPAVRLFASDDSPRFERLAERFLKEPIDGVTLVTPEALYDGSNDLPLLPRERPKLSA